MELMFTKFHFDIIRFCAIECELQGSGECSVDRMIRAWDWAMRRADSRVAIKTATGNTAAWFDETHTPGEADVLVLAAMIEPVKADGYRQVDVRVGQDVKGAWSLVPGRMQGLMGEGVKVLDPAQCFRQFEEIHPFRDGNGRTGQILYNWLNGSLLRPVFAPNFWNDPRREKL